MNGAGEQKKPLNGYEAGGVSAEWTDLSNYADDQGRVSKDRLKRDFPQIISESDEDYEARISSMMGNAGESADAASEAENKELEAGLRESYPQQPDESAEDYEARIADMKAKAEAGSSKLAEAEERDRAEMENREAARELEEFYRQAELKEKERAEAALGKKADILNGTDNDRYERAAGAQRRASDNKMEELRARIDEAVAAGEAKKLLSELREEERVGGIRDEYMASSGEMGHEGTKIGEAIAHEEESLKEAYKKLDEISEGIKKTEGEIKTIEGSIDSLKKELEDKKKEEEGRLGEVFEKIDSMVKEKKLDAKHAERLKEVAKGRYDDKIKEMEQEYAGSLEEKGKELTAKQESLQAQEQERDKAKSSVASINGRIANIKRRAKEAFPYEREEEGDEANWHGDKAYEQWLESHQPEETKKEPVKGNDGEKDTGSKQDDKDGSSEVDKGISGEDGGTDGEAEETKEGFEERLNKLAEKVAAMKKEFDARDGKVEAGSEFKARLDKLAEEILAMKKEYDALKGKGGQSKVAEAEASPEVETEPIIDRLDEVSLDDLDKLDEATAEALRDKEMKEKYSIPIEYATGVEIDANEPVEFYIEEMHRIFEGDINVDNGVVEEALRRRYNEAQEVKLNKGSSGEPLDLDKGAEEFAETPESKLIALEHDAGKAAKKGRSARAFIRSLRIGEHCAGISVYEVMEKVVRPVFFAVEGFDGDGRVKAKYDRLMNKLSAKYKKYGFDARGEEVASDGEAQERRGRVRMASRIRDFFRRGGRANDDEEYLDVDIDEAGANANE